ncbi:Os01g0144900 [Oryza sativa Japonica Group]|uniref:Os01g0144900 protein n=2 Tax=Oryza sativa subsp. japonica TaxID=39947 RepID=Q0JQQ6_ORYSJ|nr:Os01g0144900 [Oryza sativa Japonica Group]BAS70358.1 Os01g0144900 [Oryza sativa Japonica Group]|eukprot:NP_001042008.1 Os01g0144900 [Oryza sativa Japonica Group]
MVCSVLVEVKEGAVPCLWEEKKRCILATMCLQYNPISSLSYYLWLLYPVLSIYLLYCNGIKFLALLYMIIFDHIQLLVIHVVRAEWEFC